MKKILILLFSIIILPFSVYAENITISVSDGKDYSDAYSQQSDFDTIYSNFFACKFSLKVTNNTTTDIIIKDAYLQTHRKWLDHFIKNNFDKKFDLENIPTIQEYIGYKSNWGGSRGSSGIYLSVAETENLNHGWGPSFSFTSKKPLLVDTVEAIQEQFGCSSLNFMELAFDLDATDEVLFKDKRSVDKEMLIKLIKVGKAPDIFVKEIGDPLGWLARGDYFEDVGLFVGKEY